MNGKTNWNRAGRVAALAVLLTVAAPPAIPAATVAAMQQEADDRYEQARQALNRAEYERAVELFRTYREAAPKARYAAESMYWEAFALSRMESLGNLRESLDVLRRQRELYPDATAAAETEALRARIHGQLARAGDAESARWLYEHTGEEVEQGVADAARDGERQERGDRSDAAKMAALQALMNMDSEAAVPILRKVVSDRTNSPELRAQALFVLSQQDADEVMDVLLEAAREDPDEEVRGQAVFWLSQIDSPEAVNVLESILSNPQDARLHKQALFALSQMSDPRAGRILREFASSSSATSDMRTQAAFWIGQHPSPENAAFLRELFDSTDDAEARGAILFALSQMEGQGNTEWLMDIALDSSEDTEIRNNALFAASQRSDVDVADLVSLYEQASDREIKQQALFVLSRRDGSEAFDKMLDVARNESDPDLRQTAIFWIGQSDDPRAEEALLEILEN